MSGTLPLLEQFATADEFLAAWRPRAAEFDVVSFDVFDTLLRRRVHPPEVVQHAAARWLAGRLRALGVGIDADRVFARRQQVERRLRRAAAASGDDPESTLADVLGNLVAECLGPGRPPQQSAELAAAAAAHEFELQRQVLAPMPETSRLFAALQQSGKRLVLCSDMYLPAAQVAALLSENGYQLAGVPLYVSCEMGLSKATGRLHTHWLKHEGVSPRRALHIGDNLHSDIVAARRAGLTAVRFYDRREARRHRRLVSLSRGAATRDFAKGAYVCEICRPLQKLPPPSDFYYDYGRRVLGPALAVFGHRVIEESQQRGLQQLIFVAREGFLFQKVHAQLLRSLPLAHPPAVSYACLSRLSTDLADDADRPASEPAAAAAPHSQHLRRKTDYPLDKSVQRELLAEYLRGCGFWGHGRRVGLVDVGWQGTIARQLRELFGDQPEFPELHGLYFGRRGGDAMPAGDTPDVGLIYDCGTAELEMQAVLEFLPLFEEAARAPHGTTLGYRRTATDVEPVLKDFTAPGRAVELECNIGLSAMQQGAIDFATRYGQTIAWTGYTAAEMRPYLAALLTRAIGLPRRREAAGLLGFLRHAADPHGDRAAGLGLADFRPWQFDHWQRLMAHTRPCWRQGVLAQSSRALAWLFTAANYLRKWNH